MHVSKYGSQQKGEMGRRQSVSILYGVIKHPQIAQVKLSMLNLHYLKREDLLSGGKQKGCSQVYQSDDRKEFEIFCLTPGLQVEEIR